MHFSVFPLSVVDLPIGEDLSSVSVWQIAFEVSLKDRFISIELLSSTVLHLVIPLSVIDGALLLSDGLFPLEGEGGGEGIGS